MADGTTDMDAAHADSLGRRYLIEFEKDTLRPRPLGIRLIIEFLGTFILVTMAAGSGSSTITSAVVRSAGPPR
jgi:aquaporin Z